MVISVATAGLLMALAGTFRQATAGDDQATARKLRTSGQILPLEKIAQLARAAKPGKVIETELERKRDRYIYEVEVLDAQGQVWEVKLDAQSGRLIKVESED